MKKSIFQSKEMVVIVLVVFRIELLVISQSIASSEITKHQTYQVEDGNFHHTLVEIGGLIFHNFDRHNLLGLEVLTFDYLTKGSLTQNVENQITVSA